MSNNADQLNNVPFAERLRLLQSLQTYDVVARTNGLSLYRPHAKQHYFHAHGHFKYRYGRTGNRFGKSDMGVAEDVAWSIGERIWYKNTFDIVDGQGNIVERHQGREDHPLVTLGIPNRATKGLIICTDWGKAHEIFTCETRGITQGKIWKWLPEKNFVRRDVDHSGHINRFTIKSKNGDESTIYIDTVAGFKINEQRGESNWYDWIHVDEPIPEDMWNSYARGLIDHNGSAWFTCTPLREPWINKFFLPSNRTPLDPNKPNIFKNKRGIEDRIVITGKATDNPYTSEEGVLSYMEGLSDRDKSARMFGMPIEQSGLVHPWFDPMVHVYTTLPPEWAEFNKPPLDYTIRVHVDCHPMTANAVLFAATSPKGQVFFYDEIFEQCTADILAQQILNKIHGYFCPVIWMDPSGFIKTMDDKTTFADDFLEYGLVPEKASKDLLRGIQQANVALKKQGYLYFAHNLIETLNEFDTYVFQDPLKKPDKPRDKDDHMMEGLHRLVLGGLNYIPQVIYDSDTRQSANYLLTI